MTSSTSSSDPQQRAARRRAVFRALVVLVASLAALEFVTRLYFFRASKDLSRFRSYPEQAAALASTGAYRVALIGNSATEEGVNVGLLEQELASDLARPVRVTALTADNSHLMTWRWMIERYFFAPDQKVNLIVVPYFGRSLADGSTSELGRLAQFFTRFRDWPELMREDLHDLGSRLDFALSSVWATWAVRDRIRERIFLGLFPDYKAFVLRNQEGVGIRGGAPQVTQHFARLDALLALAAEHDATVCFVAMPTRDDDHEAVAAEPGLQHLAKAGACAIDLQDRGSLTAADFADAIHLNEAGRKILTARLATALEKVAGGTAQADPRHVP